MTQNESILEHLKSGKTITPLEALDLFQCLRLASRINDLKPIVKEEGEGCEIKKIMAKISSGKKVAKYFLVSPVKEKYPSIPSHAEELQKEIGYERQDRKIELNKQLTLL